MEVLFVILFDLDGTLIDSNGVWEQIDLAFLEKRGLMPTEEYAHTVGHSIFPVAAQFTKDYYHLPLSPQEIMDEWLALAWDAYAHQIPLKESASEFLVRCREDGQRIVMITACVPKLCYAALVRHGIVDNFEKIIFAQEMGLEKRDPLVFLRSAEILGVSPTVCTLYEDAPANCAAAKSAGMQVVGVYDHFYRRYEDEMRQVCDQYINRFTELLA